ncbi:Uncharacterised protein [Vibrio cholerae]|nr:Uncharacterised protein [Vibrio cholerae]
MKEAADIQSAAVAMPLATGCTPPPATYKAFSRLVCWREKMALDRLPLIIIP